MKKILVLFVALFVTATAFAYPIWDKPLHQVKVVKPSPSFDPPIYVDFQMSIVNGGAYDYVHIYFELDHTVNYTVHAVISIWGWWYDPTSGWYEGMRPFNWSIGSGLLWAYKNTQLLPGEEPNFDWYLIDSFG